MKKMIFFTVILMSAFINTQCGSSYLQDKEHYIDLFCSMQISFIDTLFSDVDNVMFRSSNYKGSKNTFVIDFVDSNRIVVIKDNRDFNYREFQSPEEGLSKIRPLPSDWRYPVNPERITLIIDFCLENQIREISIREVRNNKSLFLKTNQGVFFYTDIKDNTVGAENICGNWYFY